MKTELYLDGYRVEINDDIDFVLNKQYTELTDLTSIIVDYSKTIVIPMSPTNNELFNMVYKFQHQVLLGTEYINYDPSKKIPMVMQYNGSIVLEGYAILDKIDLKAQTYHINLYGQLGKIFSDLKKKTLKEYILDETKWSQVPITKDTVEKSFLYDRTDHTVSHETWCDYFGFAPQLYGKTDILDTTKYQDGNTFPEFKDEINTAKGITFGDTLVGDGFDFNQYGEIRSYMTRPYVYVDKLIEMVQDEINNGDYDGYSLVLDNSDVLDGNGNVISRGWFNNDNPYYSKMVYFPENEPKVGSGQSVNGHLTFNKDLVYGPTSFPYNFIPNVVDDELGDYDYTLSNGLFTIYKDDPEAAISVMVSIDMGTITVLDTYSDCAGNLNDFSDLVWGFDTYNQYNYSGIPVRYIGVYDDEDNLLHKFLLPIDSTRVHRKQGLNHTSWGYRGLLDIYRNSGNNYVVPESVGVLVTYSLEPGSTRLQNIYRQQVYKFNSQALDGNKFRFRMGCDVLSGYSGNILYENVGVAYSYEVPFKNGKWKSTLDFSSHSMTFKGIRMASISSLSYRSGTIFKMEDILGADFNPFTWLIDYVKKFRLVFDIDYFTKTIKLSNNYFSNIEYMTPEVDYSKGVVIEPIVNKFHDIRFGYADNTSEKGVQYLKKWDVDYGDMNVATSIDLNDELMWLNPNDKEGVMIPVDCSALNYDNLTSSGPIEYGNILGTSKVINTLDADGKIQYFPFFAMRTGNRTGSNYWISDDTPLQMSNGEFTLLDRSYAGGDYMIHETTIPQFDNYYINISYSTRGGGRRNLMAAPVQEFEPDIEEEQIINREERGYIPFVGEDLTPEQEIANREYEELMDELQYEQDIVVENSETDYVIIPSGGTIPVRTATGGSEGGSRTRTVTGVAVWVTFGVPKEVYNGVIAQRVGNDCIYNRWKNYLNEIFNINNKKVTCYIRMSYPEFINFKFNKLFVIDGCTFLVNKIIDFNPNSEEPTKVELIQIQDSTNLK